MRVNLKSQEGFYARLHVQLVRDDPLDTSSSGKRSLERDVVTLQSRIKFEGLAFVTKSLPKLGRALDHALVSGRFTTPEGFKTSKGRSTPAFLQAYFNLVFDEDGILLDEASAEAVKHLRQILYFAYKLELPFSEGDMERVISAFITTDKELKSVDDSLSNENFSLEQLITWKVFRGFDHRAIVPRHGPGAVATGEKEESKWEFSRLYNQIHQVYPYYDYYVVGGCNELSDRRDWYFSLQRLESGTAKVVLVPKDSRGPRLISCEPLEYQWIQQGLGRKLARHLEFDSSITRFRINFTNQEINRQLAQTSSASSQFATLDLRDASDRVSLELVRHTFRSCPNLLRALEACRTTATKLPNGSVLPLNKFAPMGSALCFPVEAYVFWVLIVAEIVRSLKLPLENVGRRVYVYGDDIIIPTHWSFLAMQALHRAGLLVNVDKSCTMGKFRESCGLDAFNGIEVTPLRLHTLWTNQKTDGSALASYASIANELGVRGYKSASNLVWNELEQCYGKIPYGTSRASYPCHVVSNVAYAVSINKTLFRHRHNSNLQRGEFLLPSLSSRRRKSKLTGWTRLLRNMVTPHTVNPSHVVVPRSTVIKRGWTAVF